MLPYYTTLHCRNQAPTNADVLGDRQRSFPIVASSSDLSDQIVVKFCYAAFSPANGDKGVALAVMPSLGEAVQDVFPLSPSEEMRGVDTVPYVTGMEYVRFVVGNLAVNDQVSNSMRRLGVFGGDPELPVAAFYKRGRPQPTRIRATAAVNLVPKSLNLFRGKLHLHVTAFRDVPRRGCYSTARLSVLCEQLYQIGATT